MMHSRVKNGRRAGLDLRFAMPWKLFFATAWDLESRLAEFERQSGIKYVRAGWYASPKADEYRSFREIPDFGMEPSELISAAREFIVVRPDYDIQFERIDLIDGGIDFIVGRSSNPESLVLRPGGIYREGVLIGGGVATAS